jgi:hypothetical protein
MYQVLYVRLGLDLCEDVASLASTDLIPRLPGNGWTVHKSWIWPFAVEGSDWHPVIYLVPPIPHYPISADLLCVHFSCSRFCIAEGNRHRPSHQHLLLYTPCHLRRSNTYILTGGPA